MPKKKSTSRRPIPTRNASSPAAAVGYRSVSVAQREGRAPSAASGDRHAQYDRAKCVAQSRELYRDNCLYAGIIDRTVGYIVGNGFGLSFGSPDKEHNDNIESRWRSWWKEGRPEVRGILPGPDAERMVCRELLCAGDTGIILANGGLIQLIESEQIADGSTGDGIRKNAQGRATAYSVCPYSSKTGQVETKRGKEYKPDFFLFLSKPDRPSSTRGVPPCQAAFPIVQYIGDICQSEAISWNLLSRIALSVTQTDAARLAHLNSSEDSSADTTASPPPVRITELDYALVFNAEPGSEVKGVERNIPGKDFAASLTMFLRIIGLPLGLPLEITLLDWTKSNYSQSRAVLEQAFMNFLAWQDLLEFSFYRPLLDWKILEWTGQTKAAAPELYRYAWIRPTFPWIDKLKEAQAYGEQLDRGMVTHALVCKTLHEERENIVAARRREVEEAIRIADEIGEQTGTTPPWQMFCGLKAPKAETRGRPADGANTFDDEGDSDVLDD